MHERSMLCSVQASGDPGPTYIPPTAIAIGAAVIVVNAAVSLWLQLGLHWQLAVGAVRCIVQLSVLGYILVPIFRYNYWWLVLLYGCFMLLVGAYEAVSRPAYSYTGMLAKVVACVGSSAAVFLAYTLVLVVRTEPWWQAQYFIPILGMLLGNAISGVSVGLSTLLEELATGKDRIELKLAIGASRWEATQETLQRATRVALTPILNQMNVVGIVSIPGMMTGQILSGSDPSQAARYQMIIMFMIAATTAAGSVSTLMLATFYIVDGSARLRTDRLHRRERKDSWAARLQAWLGKALAPVGACLERAGKAGTALLCCQPCRRQHGKGDIADPLLDGHLQHS
ncbi:hypothetical protein WJX81_000987 [Elliptochloris bilobata]|uniref:Uncharacterized protein n=1 Tax=Elliptochloris bilobata TaxID=381761 RepID=A0AAW1S4T2_9CHLO